MRASRKLVLMLIYPLRRSDQILNFLALEFADQKLGKSIKNEIIIWKAFIKNLSLVYCRKMSERKMARPILKAKFL